MEDINRVVIVGELVGNSTFGQAAGGTAVATFTLAFPSGPDERRNVKRKKGTIDIIFFGAEAHRWAQLLKKGAQVVVEGRLQQRSWKTLEGIHRSKTEIIANQVRYYNSSRGKREKHDIK